MNQRRHKRPSLPFSDRRHQLILLALVIGAWFGSFVLRPINDVVAWYEHEVDAPSPWVYAWSDLRGSLGGAKPAKTAFYAVTGALFSLLAALFYSSVHQRNHRIDELTAELGRDLDALIALGESERLEFKSSFRWDLVEQRINRGLESVIMKSLAGFLNGRGGTLLIGVSDQGEVLGLQHDYRSLKRGDRDGFEQALVGAVAHQLGGDLVPCLQIVFHQVQDREICRVIVDPAPRPVYLEQSGAPRLYLRSGVSTRELNVKEALAYQGVRWPV